MGMQRFCLPRNRKKMLGELLSTKEQVRDVAGLTRWRLTIIRLDRSCRIMMTLLDQDYVSLIWLQLLRSELCNELFAVLVLKSDKQSLFVFSARSSVFWQWAPLRGIKLLKHIEKTDQTCAFSVIRCFLDGHNSNNVSWCCIADIRCKYIYTHLVFPPLQASLCVKLALMNFH